MKGLAPEEFAARNDLVQALSDRIQEIPDGGAAAPKQTGGWAASASRTNNIKFDSGGHLFQFRWWIYHYVRLCSGWSLFTCMFDFL